MIVEHRPDGRTVMDTAALAAVTARPAALIRRHCTRDQDGRYDAQTCPEVIAELPDPILLSARDAQQYLGIPAGTVYSWVSRGLLTPLDRTPTGRPLYDLDHLTDLHHNREERS